MTRPDAPKFDAPAGPPSNDQRDTHDHQDDGRGKRGRYPDAIITTTTGIEQKCRLLDLTFGFRYLTLYELCRRPPGCRISDDQTVPDSVRADPPDHSSQVVPARPSKKTPARAHDIATSMARSAANRASDYDRARNASSASISFSNADSLTSRTRPDQNTTLRAGRRCGNSSTRRVGAAS